MKYIIKLTVAIILSGLTGKAALAATVPNHWGQFQPPNTPPLLGTNVAPNFGSNTPPVNGTNYPLPSSTNRPPNGTNVPPDLGTNAATRLAAEAAVFYAAVAHFDTNASGILNAAEQQALVAALTNGTVALSGTNAVLKVPAAEVQNILIWAVALYEQIAPFDVSHAGTLSETEQEALATALEEDKLPLLLFIPLWTGPAPQASLSHSASTIRLARANPSLEILSPALSHLPAGNRLT